MPRCKLSEDLLAAIDADGRTLYQIAKDADIALSGIYGFYHDNRDLRLSVIDRLASTLGLAMLSDRKRRGSS